MGEVVGPLSEKEAVLVVKARAARNGHRCEHPGCEVTWSEVHEITPGRPWREICRRYPPLMRALCAEHHRWAHLFPLQAREVGTMQAKWATERWLQEQGWESKVVGWHEVTS